MKNKLLTILWRTMFLGSLFFIFIQNLLAVDNIFITEVMRMGDSERRGYEWLELYNPNSFDVDLSGWTLQETEKFQLTLASGSTITGSGFMIIAHYGENYVGSGGKTPVLDYNQLDIYYDNNSQSKKYSYKDLNFPNSGTGQLILRNGSGAIINQLSEQYYDLGGINDSGQAKQSLVRKYLQNGLDPQNWGTADFSTNLKLGSADVANPGRWVEAPVVTPIDLSGLKISEVLPNPGGADPGNEWIELSNSGSVLLDIDKFTLVINGSKKYTFSGATILPGDFFMLENFSFSLGNSGQHWLEVFSNTGLLVTDLSYGEPIYEGLSFSQVEDQVVFTHPSYGTGNSLANEAPQAVIGIQSGGQTLPLGNSLNLTGEDSFDPDKDDIRCDWDFGTGSGWIITDNCNPGYFKYDQLGSYNVTLTVTDLFGESDVENLWITVVNGSSGNQVQESRYLKVNNLRDLQNIDAYKDVYLENIFLSSKIDWFAEREAYVYDQTGSIRIKVDKNFDLKEYFQAGDKVNLYGRLYKKRDGRPSSISRARLIKVEELPLDFTFLDDINLEILQVNVFKPVKVKGKVDRVTPKTKMVYLQDVEEEGFSLKIKVSKEIAEQISTNDKVEIGGLLKMTEGKSRLNFTLYPYNDDNVWIESWQEFCLNKDWSAVKKDLRIKQILPAPLKGEEEYFVLENKGEEVLDLQCLQIDDALNKGSKPWNIRHDLDLEAGTELVFRRRETKLNLNNISDSLNIILPNGEVLEGWQWECSVNKGDIIDQRNKRNYCQLKMKSRGRKSSFLTKWIKKNLCADFYLNHDSTLWQGIKIKQIYPTPLKGESEYFTIQNIGEETVDLKCLQIDDDLEKGSKPWTVTGSVILKAGQSKRFLKTETKLGLNNSNDSLNLLWSGNAILDSWSWPCAVKVGDILTTENITSYCQPKLKVVKKEKEDIYLQIKEIANLNALPTQTKVFLTATLNSPFGLLEERTAFFEDDSGGIRVKLDKDFSSQKNLANFTIGSQYRIQGRLFNSKDGLSISYAQATPVDLEQNWNVQQVPISFDLTDNSTDLAFLNRRKVAYQGEIIKNSRGQVVIKDENLAVYFHANLSYPKFKLADSDQIKVQWVLQKKADKYKIYPLEEDDFQFMIKSETKDLLDELASHEFQKQAETGILGEIMGMLSSLIFLGWGVVRLWIKF